MSQHLDHHAGSRLPGRSTKAFLAAGTILLACAIARILLGNPFVPIDYAARIIIGDNIPGFTFIVMERRLPTTIVGILAGMAFGLSGTVLQTMLRNPLASPDVIGVTLGSSAGAVLAMAYFGAHGTAIFWCSLVGGVLSATVVMVASGLFRRTAAPRSGGAVDRRFILSGVGVAAALSALVSYVLTRMPTKSAADAVHWRIGSLSSSTWDRITVLALALGVLVPALALLVPRLRILELGDDTATGLGLPVARTRIALITVAVGLSAVTVAVTGPLAFVAFLAGPLARLFFGRPTFVGSALIGAAIVLGADIAGSTLVPGATLPAGVITGALGAPVLLWLLVRSSHSSGR